MHQQQGRQVGNRIYYGNYTGGCCGNPQNRNRCLLIALTFLLIFIGSIITIVGFTVTPFWSEDDARTCSFCRDDRETTLRNTANCRIAGPIILGLGALVLIFTIYYSKKHSAANQGTVINTAGQTGGPAPSTTLSYASAHPATTTTTIHPPPQQYPPSQPYPPTQYPPQSSYQPPSPYPPQSSYPQPPSQQPPGTSYPPPTSQYPPASSYPAASAPQMPPPPSYNDATGPSEKY